MKRTKQTLRWQGLNGLLSILRRSCLVLLCGAFAAGASAQELLPGYTQARRFTADRLQTMLFSTVVAPHWTPKGDRFWYSYQTGAGTRWYLVDALARTRRPLFDQEALAAQLSELTKDPCIAERLPLERLEAQEDGTFTFQVTSSQDTQKKDKQGKKKKGKEIFYFSYNADTRQLTRLEKDEPEKYPAWASVSPDGKWVVYAKNLNLFCMSRDEYAKAKKDEKDSTLVEKQLTQFGVEGFGFGEPYSRLNTDTVLDGKRKRVYAVWAPDSRHFAILLTDNRRVKPLWVINSMANPRPTLETYPYQMPGEKEAPKDYLFVFNMPDGSYRQVQTDRFKDQTLEMSYRPRRQTDRDRHEVASVWLGNNDRFYLTRKSRDLHRVDVCKYTVGQDSIQPVIEERMNTYIETHELAAVSGGKELIQWSERTGWAHLYLYDENGTLKNAITQGAWHVQEVLGVDERARVVYFTANGRKDNPNGKEGADWNPYYQQLYRVNLDGSGLKALTHGDYYHEPSLADGCRYYVDNYSRVNTVPRSAVYDNNGTLLLELEQSDFTQLFAAGYKFPEPFRVKAADGTTDLYGVMYKPFDFDSTKVYPIIDYVYPGPQVEATYYPFTRMSLRTDRLAQAGFIVISVGNRGGHPDRSKWYHNFGYGNLRDYGLADQKAAIEQLADRFPYIDANRVGIHGHSGGGFMSTAAILQYPDFFKVAVSCAGNHDNSIYNRWWSETHHGVKEEVSEKGDTTFVYHIATNQAIASRLKGHLLLVHGDIDDNVHPGNTLRVVDALIRAGKRFDMLVLPQQRHGFGDMNEYFYWRLVDYFSEYLLGKRENAVDIPRMK